MSMIIDPYRFSSAIIDPGTVPNNGSNLRVWLESNANVFYNSSNQVDYWYDQTTYHNDAVQPTPSYKPLAIGNDPAMNNLQSISFQAGSDDALSIASSSSLNLSANGFSIYVVANISSWFSTWAMMLQHSNGSTWTQGWGMLVYNNQLRFFVNNWNNLPNYIPLAVPALNTRTLYKFTWNKTTITGSYRQNGVTTSGSKAYSGPYVNPVEGIEIMRGGFGATSLDTSGKLGAILIYDGILSAQDDLSLQNYLKNKYGIA